MDEDRHNLIRRMFTALTVLAERAGDDAVGGQSHLIDAEKAQTLAGRIRDAAHIGGVLAEAIYALASAPSA